MKIHTLNIGILFMVCLGCTNINDSSLTIDNLKIKEALERRKALYASEILDNCRTDIMRMAEIYIDSLISADMDFRLSDSIIFPEKPLKPLWPGDISVSDTIKAYPIFKNKGKM